MATQTTSLPDGSTLTKPEYTDPADIAEINSNMDKIVNNINKGNTDVVQLSDGLAIVANGNTHAAISSGQFVYVRNHGTLSDGLYKASTAISANGALSTSNLTPDGSGGLNALKGDIDALNSKIKSFTKTVTIPDTGEVDINISAETNGVNPTGTIVKLGNNYALPYYSGNQMTYIEIANDNLIRIRNNTPGWGTQTAHIVLIF